jgi:hypothetical protein
MLPLLETCGGGMARHELRVNLLRLLLLSPCSLAAV